MRLPIFGILPFVLGMQDRDIVKDLRRLVLEARIELAFAIALDGKAQDHARRRRERDGGQKPGEAEQTAKSEKRENQPDRMQADGFTNKLRRQYIAFEKLPGEN